MAIPAISGHPAPSVSRQRRVRRVNPTAPSIVVVRQGNSRELPDPGTTPPYAAASALSPDVPLATFFTPGCSETVVGSDRHVIAQQQEET
jgi:hypothetical protein